MDIIAKTPAAEPQTVLPIIWGNAFEFDERVPPAAVIRIALEDEKGLLLAVRKIGVPAAEAMHEPIKVRSGANRKRGRHGC